MTQVDRNAESALRSLESDIKNAWLDIHPQRRQNGLALRSFVDQNPISVSVSDGCGGDAFACQPSFGLITMKWWSLEVLWLSAYVFHDLGARLWRRVQNGDGVAYLEDDPELRVGRDALAHAALLIQNRASHEWPSNIPHPSDGSASAKNTTEVFLASLAWIELHEIGHITVDRACFDQTASPDLAEEEYCDTFANEWVGSTSLSTAQQEGIAVSQFFLVLREALQGPSPKTHPSAQQRADAAAIGHRHRGWLAIVLDILLQSGGNQTPAQSRQQQDPTEYLSNVFDALYRVLADRHASRPAV